MRSWVLWLGAAFLLGLLSQAGCGKQDQAGSGHQQQQAAAGQQTGRSGHGARKVAGESDPQGRPAKPATPVATAAAITGDIASYYRATATLEAEKQAQVLARATGVVESLLCEEGDLLDAGSPLLRIENDEYRLRLAQAQANTANLQAIHDRLERMHAEELASDEEYQTARSNLETAKAEEGLARLNLSYTTVTAPFTGKVIQRLVDPGQNVSNGTPLFLLADFDPLLARVYVPAKEFKKLQQDQAVQLILDSDRQKLSGTIKLISPIIDPTSGTIKVTVEIPTYPAGTRPGDFAEVQIVTELRTATTLVPRIAVLTDKGDDVVFVAVAGIAERRVVEVGFKDSEHAEILMGVVYGEPVVVKGQRSLKHGDPLKILSGEGAKPDAPAAAHSLSDSTANPTAGS
jgi:membrane fusion protein (multidrug efflux system)